MPPLHGSCHKGSSKEVRKLVSMGEDVNEQVQVDDILATKSNPNKTQSDGRRNNYILILSSRRCN